MARLTCDKNTLAASSCFKAVAGGLAGGLTWMRLRNRGARSAAAGRWLRLRSGDNDAWEMESDVACRWCGARRCEVLKYLIPAGIIIAMCKSIMIEECSR